MKNALIFPCGSENALELYDSLRYSPHFRIFGASGVRDISADIYPPDRICQDLPFMDDPEFIRALNGLINRFAIDMIFSTHDSVLLKLVSERDTIKANVLGCDLETALLCRDKCELYRHFAGEDFIPKWALANPDFPPPYFIKPADGQGGKGCMKADVPDCGEGMLICEYLPGNEYTVDCFTDRHGKLLFVGPRSRGNIKMGIAFESVPVAASAEITAIADRLNDSLGFRGLWFFQLKEDAAGGLKLLEISSRVATTMGLYRQLGVNLPLMTAYDALDFDVMPLRQSFPIALRRRLHNVYSPQISYGKLYIDYDDTLVINGKVNVLLMQLIYQSVNEGKKLILLTRHEGNLTADMRVLRIDPTLFDEIVHLPPDADKLAHVVDRDAIYIDNMFHDRLAVAKLGIPVFDADAVQALVKE